MWYYVLCMVLTLQLAACSEETHDEYTAAPEIEDTYIDQLDAFGLKFVAGFNVLDFTILILIVAMVALTFSSIFVALGLVIKNQDVLMGVNMLLNLPLMFASGVLFPTASFPEALKVIANVNPLTYAADAARRVSVGDVMISIPNISLGMDLLLLFIVAITITALGMFFARRGLRA